MIEKTGDISSQTPHPEEPGEKQGQDAAAKQAPSTPVEADKMEDGAMTRVSDAAAKASKD